MKNPKCNLPPEEREDIFGHFRGSFTAAEEDAARTLFPQYLFFQNAYDDNGLDVYEDRSTRICFCTSCRQSFTAVRGNWARGKLHNEPCNCPNCGARVEGKAVGKYQYHMPSLTSWIKTAVAYAAPDGGMLIEAGDCRRRFSWDDLAGEIDWYPTKRYYFRAAKKGEPGLVQMWYESIVYACSGWEGAETAWITRTGISEPFAPNVMGYADYWGDYNVIGLGDALEESDFKYCQIEDFYRYEYAAELAEGASCRWIIKYLAWYALMPQLEFAVKLGFGEAVRELIENGKKNAQLLDWNASTPPAFLRMDKQEARIFLQAEMTFADLKTWRETAKGKSFATFLTLADMVGGSGNLRAVSACAKDTGLDLGKAARYIARLIPPCSQYAPPTSRIIQTWKDYLDMANRLNYDLKEPTVLMPKDLQQRHDTAAELLNELGRLDEMKRYKARRKKLEKKYSFAMDELRIVIPNSAEEIIQEGKTLHHCVGGYAARHIDGKTTILFLRKRRTPGRSFLTIEMVTEKGKEKIRQIHGYRNEGYAFGQREKVSPRERFAWFLDPWLEWVNSGSKRDKQGQPILPEIKEEKEVIIA